MPTFCGRRKPGAPHIPPGQLSFGSWFLGLGILGIGGLVGCWLVGWLLLVVGVLVGRLFGWSVVGCWFGWFVAHSWWLVGRFWASKLFPTTGYHRLLGKKMVPNYLVPPLRT